MATKDQFPCPGCGHIRTARNPAALCQACRQSSKKLSLTPEQMQWALKEARRIRAIEESRTP